MRKTQRGSGSEPGEAFSLIELLVALMVVAILAGIAFPLLKGVQDRSADTETRAALTTAIKVQAAVATADGEFTTDGGRLALIEPALDWAGIEPDSIHVLVGEVVSGSGVDDQVLLYSQSHSGRWFGIRLVASGGLAGRHSCEGPGVDAVNEFVDCVGTDW